MFLIPVFSRANFLARFSLKNGQHPSINDILTRTAVVFATVAVRNASSVALASGTTTIHATLISARGDACAGRYVA